MSQLHNCVSIQDTPFCAHRTRKTISYLRSMGYDEEQLVNLGSGDTTDLTQESYARDRFLDTSLQTPATYPDPSMKEVWVTEAYIRLDYDGDGIAELRKVVKAGSEILENEEVDQIPFAAITPNIMPHRWVGKSVAELVMDIQYTKSVIWRQMLNNLYLTNNPRKAVLSSPSGVAQANIDDLMNSVPGGIVREYAPNAVRDMEVPFVAGASFPMLEYMDGIKENRTGQTRYNQGTDADSLNKTARGVALIQQAGQQRQDLIARIFAETGVKDLMRGISYMLSRYSSKQMTLRLRNKWVDIDPREWKTQFDMTVNVGLGTGNRDLQLGHLKVMGEVQLALMQSGRGYMVTDDNVYNVGKKMAENMGFKHPELFISDPASVQKPQPQPNPDLIKIQTEAQIDQAKLQQNQQKLTVDTKLAEMIEQIKAQTLVAIAEMDNATKIQIENMRIQAQAQIEAFRNNQSFSDKEKMLADREADLALREISLKAEEGLRKLADNIDEESNAATMKVAEMLSQFAPTLNQQSEVIGRLSNEVGKLGQAAQTSAQAAKAAADRVKAKITKVERVKEGERLVRARIHRDDGSQEDVDIN